MLMEQSSWELSEIQSRVVWEEAKAKLQALLVYMFLLPKEMSLEGRELVRADHIEQIETIHKFIDMMDELRDLG